MISRKYSQYHTDTFYRSSSGQTPLTAHYSAYSVPYNLCFLIINLTLPILDLNHVSKAQLERFDFTSLVCRCMDSMIWICRRFRFSPNYMTKRSIIAKSIEMAFGGHDRFLNVPDAWILQFSRDFPSYSHHFSTHFGPNFRRVADLHVACYSSLITGLT